MFLTLQQLGRGLRSEHCGQAVLTLGWGRGGQRRSMSVTVTLGVRLREVALCGWVGVPEPDPGEGNGEAAPSSSSFLWSFPFPSEYIQNPSGAEALNSAVKSKLKGKHPFPQGERNVARGPGCLLKGPSALLQVQRKSVGKAGTTVRQHGDSRRHGGMRRVSVRGWRCQGTV